MTARLDLVGNRFGRLVVVARALARNTGRHKCVCDCGSITIVWPDQRKHYFLRMSPKGTLEFIQSKAWKNKYTHTSLVDVDDHTWNARSLSR